MRIKLIALLVAVFIGGSCLAQDTYYSIFSYRYFIPKVRINDRAISLQQSVLPELYRERSAARDLRWVTENDSAITAFWQQQGDTVLHILREFSGIEWYESEFDIYLLRYFPAIGSPDPLIVPIGGMKQGSLIEAAPEGNRLIFNLIFQLARRMLAQADQREDSVTLSIAYHPLMRPGAYRQDNLALLLTFNTCQNIIGLDSTLEAYESAFCRNKFPGRGIFEKYLKDTWFLSPGQTLADWVANEPATSQLVHVTRPPRRTEPISGDTGGQYVEGLPLKGQLGFSVRRTASNQLVVDNIDVYRLAYACGLRTGDIIRRVDGRVVRNHKALIENILSGLDGGSSVVQIVREDRTEEVIIQPVMIDPWSEEYQLEEEYLDDYDSLEVDTSLIPTNDF